jgi:hypothetical protein
MLSLLAEIYQQMPEKGDADQPELVIFSLIWFLMKLAPHY